MLFFWITDIYSFHTVDGLQDVIIIYGNKLLLNERISINLRAVAVIENYSTPSD